MYLQLKVIIIIIHYAASCDSAFEHIHEVSPCIYTITKQLM